MHLTKTAFAAVTVFALGAFIHACGGADPSQVEDAEGSTESALIVHPISYCGAAGQTCCDTFPECNTGLVCNANNICRTPCGGLGQRCCSNVGCDDGLSCQTGICRTAPPPPPPDPACVPCATRTCGWDASCGPNTNTYCGGCPSGGTCNAIGQCGGAIGDPPSPCTLSCPSGQSCQQDFYGQFCGIQP